MDSATDKKTEASEDDQDGTYISLKDSSKSRDKDDRISIVEFHTERPIKEQMRDACVRLAPRIPRPNSAIFIEVGTYFVLQPTNKGTYLYVLMSSSRLLDSL